MVQVGFRVGRTENENTQERKEVRIMAKKKKNLVSMTNDELRKLNKRLEKQNKNFRDRIKKIDSLLNKRK